MANSQRGAMHVMASLVVALACVLGQARAAEPIVVGVAVPFSGPVAQTGENIKRGIEVAVERINGAGGIKALGGAPLKMIYADVTSDPSTGANVVTRMVGRDNPVAIQGCYGSSVTVAASEVTERQRVPMLTQSFSDIIIGRGYHHIFQVVAPASVQGRGQLEHTVEMAKKAGQTVSSIAIVFEDTAFGKSQAEGAQKNAAGLGLKVVLYETYAPGLTDAVPLVNKIAATKPDAILINSTVSDAVLIVRATRQMGMDMPIVAGGAGFLEPDFYKAIKEGSENILVEAPVLGRGPLDKAYRAKYGVFMSHSAFEHAIITEIIAQALEKTASRDPEKLSKALHEMTFTQGDLSYMPGGGVKFDDRGANVMGTSVMAQWQGGELVPVWPPREAVKPYRWRGKTVSAK
jgi:branched-chain amino acid transport system substrate-binding protein